MGSAPVPLVRAHVRVRGRVQGVGFRYAVEAEAIRHNLYGWVRNLESGAVEAIFEGPRSVVEQVVAWCRQGPPSAYVRDFHVTWDEPLQGLSDFSILPTADG